MRSWCSIILCLSFFVGLVPKVQAEIDPRVKTVGVMAGYGAASGTLLGIATLAFDGEVKNIAKGASIGLYAGILFGSFIVISHHMRKNSKPSPADNYYEDESPYDGAGEAPASPYEAQGPAQLFDEKILKDLSRDNMASLNADKNKNAVVLGLPLLAFSF